jgi:LysM repeat protein
MKLKKLLLSITPLVISSSLYASNAIDSVGVENLNGKKVILHKLDPKDNYYSIGRKYGVSPKVIQQFNNNASMQIGKIIKVPTERSIVETVSPNPTATQAQNKPVPQQQVTQPVQNKPVTQQPVSQPAPATQNKPVIQQPVTPPATQPEQKTAASGTTNGVTVQQYKVSAGETLYSIAKRFGTTVEDLTATNKLTAAIQPGQVLQVRTGVPAPPPAPVAPIDSLMTKRDSTAVVPDSLSRNTASNRYGLFEKNEKGAATYIEDASLDPNKKLILHRTAPIGTVMRITNPMNNKTTFAKVVGRFTDTQATKDVIIVMTKNVAESLGALDKRFHVNISYGTPNE